MRFLAILLFLCPLLCAGYTAKTLKLKDYEEMRAIVTESIKRSREKAPQQLASDGLEEAILELKKGLKVLLMRPDTDNINSSLILMIQNEIVNHRAFMPVFKEVVESSVKEFKSKKGSVSYQTGLLYLIENAISYLQSINTKESTEILMDVKEANLKISKKLANYLILEMERGKTASPSYLAKRILAKRLKENKQAEERKKAEEKKAKQAEEEKLKQAQEEKSDKKRQPSSEKPGTSIEPTVEVEL
ncbi:MAG: hypothetical protein OXJ52_09770 [Oligoflexia bacterium]|nr:hypothetical protein [Oligoflexia bacterium]